MLSLALAGALVGAPNPTLTALAPNTAMDLGAFPCNQPAGDGSISCARVTDYSGFVYDPVGHRMLMFGGGHATTMTDALFVFDPDTLAWTELFPSTTCAEMVPSNFDQTRAAWLAGANGPYPRPYSRHTYDLLAVDPVTGEFIVAAGANGGQQNCPQGFDWTSGDPFFSSGRIAHFDFGTSTWAFSPDAPGDGFPDLTWEYPAAEMDPTSGLLVFFGRYSLFTYDPTTQVKTRQLRGDWGEYQDASGANVSSSQLGYASQLVYAPNTDRMYYFDRSDGGVWELNLNRSDFSLTTITRVAATGPTSPHGEPGFAYDSANGIIGGGISDGVFYAFDPLTSTWTAHAMQGGPVGTMAFHALDYDPVNNVFVFITDTASGRHTWAYRFAPGVGGLPVPAAPVTLTVR